ncbi:MAG TPA: hypothetical protein DCZ94_04355 [Lentisphaeria bacterium]|nr:hypothetical protein [Lentisphaeria bacterium]
MVFPDALLGRDLRQQVTHAKVEDPGSAMSGQRISNLSKLKLVLQQELPTQQTVFELCNKFQDLF